MHTEPAYPILVTGGTGFIGSHVVDQLLADGHAVRCLVRPTRSSLSWLHDLPVEIARVDTDSADELSGLLKDVRTVIHVAGVTKGRTAEDYTKGNVDLTRSLIEASIHAGVRRFILVSSLTAVGPSPDGTPLDESAPCLPITPYGASKLEAEKVCRSYADRIAVTILRPPAVYGPRDKDVLEMFRWVSFGLRPIIGTPRKTVSILHAHDLARAIVHAAFDSRTIGKTYHLSDPAPYRFEELIRGIALAVGRRTFPFFLPGPLLYAVAAVSQFVSLLLGRQAVLTIEKARDILQPSWVCSSHAFTHDTGISSTIPLAEGLQQTYDWYKTNRWL